MKITEYQTVAEPTAAELDKGVNALINRGFELYGDPYSSGGGTEKSLICQAMVKIQSVAEGSDPNIGAETS